ncbi:MAG: hypothetical protein VX278_12140, partial [Myxococcota bacterium]|nr:hypothetical protein [Myxococcota bacterium]
MNLSSDDVSENTAFVLVWEPDGFDNLNFYWNIEGELLGFSEPLFQENAFGSKITIQNPDPTWNNDELSVFIFNDESGLSTERKWTINIIEGN